MGTKKKKDSFMKLFVSQQHITKTTGILLTSALNRTPFQVFLVDGGLWKQFTQQQEGTLRRLTGSEFKQWNEGWGCRWNGRGKRWQRAPKSWLTDWPIRRARWKPRGGGRSPLKLWQEPGQCVILSVTLFPQASKDLERVRGINNNSDYTQP